MDGSSKLGLVEFHHLWTKVQRYLEVFKSHDSDGSGTMSSHEMRAALAEAGFQVNSAVIQEIVSRYTDTSYAIDFDCFIGCLIRLEMLFKMFRILDKKNQGQIQLDLQQVKLNPEILHKLIFDWSSLLSHDFITELLFSSCSGSASPSTDGCRSRCHAPLGNTHLQPPNSPGLRSMAGIAATLQHRRDLSRGDEALRQRCFQSGQLFQDAFPALPSSLGFKELGPHSHKARGVSWKRQSPRAAVCVDLCFDLCVAPTVDQSARCLVSFFSFWVTGDCWLAAIAAIACLTLNEEVTWLNEESSHGQLATSRPTWTELQRRRVRRHLPLPDGELLFVHSAEGREFWSTLLEKAYAKLNGSYEALSGGSTTEGFEDFTGGIAEVHELSRPSPHLFHHHPEGPEPRIPDGLLHRCKLSPKTWRELQEKRGDQRGGN
ncbi:hypothetical protein L3Q82_005583 [Scortum barcoo]|uniref:Uncharacterized protein n=1 Tax=Scortum barcoo TaxID=214431 RepID=A0ACB8V9C4_9TELE|nr:hypothetical protein L3Q82_005583 [Scortum barcoo]